MRLQWPTLTVRRRKQKVVLCYRILNNCSIIPPTFFTPHPSPQLRHNHSIPLYYPSVCTTSHHSSFSVSVVPIWNCLPSDRNYCPPFNLFITLSYLHHIHVSCFLFCCYIYLYNFIMSLSFSFGSSLWLGDLSQMCTTCSLIPRPLPVFQCCTLKSGRRPGTRRHVTISTTWP